MNKIKQAKTLRKPPPIVSNANNVRDGDTDLQFELELCWCIQQLENALNSQKLNQKLANDTLKNIKVLKSGSTPLVKKRQVMKAALGDYRTKMKEEEKKLSLAAKQIKFTNSLETAKKSSFVKKSAILTSGQDFRFNFASTAPDAGSEMNSSDLNDEPKIVTQKLNLNSSREFKFNFAIPDETLNFDELTIKN